MEWNSSIGPLCVIVWSKGMKGKESIGKGRSTEKTNEVLLEWCLSKGGFGFFYSVMEEQNRADAKEKPVESSIRYNRQEERLSKHYTRNRFFRSFVRSNGKQQNSASFPPSFRPGSTHTHIPYKPIHQNPSKKRTKNKIITHGTAKSSPSRALSCGFGPSGAVYDSNDSKSYFNNRVSSEVSF